MTYQRKEINNKKLCQIMDKMVLIKWVDKL